MLTHHCHSLVEGCWGGIHTSSYHLPGREGSGRQRKPPGQGGQVAPWEPWGQGPDVPHQRESAAPLGLVCLCSLPVALFYNCLFPRQRAALGQRLYPRSPYLTVGCSLGTQE